MMFDELMGQLLDGKYELRSELGSGGMGVVLSAHDHRLGRDVAVKIVRPELALWDEAVEALIAEARIIARLAHPNILRVYDLGHMEDDDGRSFYQVMQLAGGSTLEERIPAEGLPLGEVDRILKQVCAALDYAHGQGVIHLDLKPRNILFDGRDNAMVADFGLARLLEQATRVKTYARGGTQEYMPPEQLFGDQVGPFSDIYALGITLHRMLTGKLPRRKWTEDGLVVELEPSLPPGVQPIVERATHADPHQRYHTAGELAQAFSAALGSVPDQVMALREALRKLGRFCEQHPDAGEDAVVRYAFEQAGLFAALGYGELDQEGTLDGEGISVVLAAEERPSAVVTFLSPGCSIAERRVELEQRYIAPLQPDTGVLCNGSELWISQRAETGTYLPALRLSLSDASGVDAQATYSWLRRRSSEPGSAFPAAAAGSGRPRWWVVAVPVLMAALVGLAAFGIGHGWFAGLGAGAPPRSTAETPAGSSSVTSEPFVVPSPIPTATNVSVLVVATVTPSPTSTALPTLTPTPSETLVPRSTSTRTRTPTPTRPSTPVPTATPIFAVTAGQAEVYAGPGQLFAVLGQVQQDATLPATGRTEDSEWVRVLYLGWSGWIEATSGRASVPAGMLPVVQVTRTPSVSPTPVPCHPRIEEISPSSPTVEAWHAVKLTCVLSCDDAGSLAYAWQASDGTISGKGGSVIYRAPDVVGSQTVSVTVRDEQGDEDQETVQIPVLPAHPAPGTAVPGGPLDEVWYSYLQIRRSLGWAVGEGGPSYGAQQTFERGVMFWWQDRDQIYVLVQDGSWQVYADDWEEDMGEYSCLSDDVPSETPPTPKRGFGLVWCREPNGVHAQVGWAVTEEMGYHGHWQRFERGTMWQGHDGQVYVLYDDNTWERPTGDPPLLLIDDFEGYDDDAALGATYGLNGGGPNVAHLALAARPDVRSGEQSVAFSYEIRDRQVDYSGFERALDPQDWRGYGGLRVWVQSEPSGMDLVVQFREAGGEVWKYRTSLSDLSARDLWIPFDEGALEHAVPRGASSSRVNGQIDLDAVDSYGVFVSGGSLDAGTIYVDYMRLVQ